MAVIKKIVTESDVTQHEAALTITESQISDLGNYITLSEAPVQSVNGQTGTVVLDADDIGDTSTTNKFVTAADLTTLSNTSGTNTGDQTITLTGDVTGTGTGSFATTVTEMAVTQHVSAIDHDLLLNFSVNEHIDWTNATQNLLTTGSGQFGNIVVSANQIGNAVTNGNVTILGNGTGSVVFGQVAGFWTISSTGQLSPNGAAGYSVPINTRAFYGAGFPSTGLGFFTIGGARYAFFDLAGADLMAVDVLSTYNTVYATNGFSQGAASPAAYGASQNNLSLAAAGMYRLSASTPINITGFVAPTRSTTRTVFNIGANAITLTHQDAASTAANRILSVTGANIALAQNEGAQMMYDLTTQRWRAWKL